MDDLDQDTMVDEISEARAAELIETL